MKLMYLNDEFVSERDAQRRITKHRSRQNACSFNNYVGQRIWAGAVDISISTAL